MSTFSTFNAPTSVAVGNGGRRADAADFGADGGLKSLGSDLAQTGKVLKVREDKRSITQARAGYANMRTEFEKEQALRRQNAPLGAEGFVEDTQAEYDAAVGKLTENFNDVQMNALASEMASGRLSIVRGAIGFKAEQTVKADLIDVGTLQLAIRDKLTRGEITYEEAQVEFGEVLIDTTIGAAGQHQLATAALPEFRTAMTNAAVSNPLQGFADLEAGKYDFLPEAERARLENDLVKAIDGLAEKTKMTNFAHEVTKNNTAFNLALNGGTLAELDQYTEGMSTQTVNILKDLIIDRDTPFRTAEEQANRQAELLAEYADFGISKKDGKYKSSAAMEDLLRFQTTLMTAVAEGYVSKESIATMMGSTEILAQAGVDGSGKAWWKWNDDDPFSLVNTELKSVIDANGWGAAQHTAIAERAIKALDASGLNAGTPETPERNAQVSAIVLQAIEDEFRARNPSLRYFEILPSGVIKTDGTIDMKGTGEGGGDVDRVIDTGVTVGQDRVTGQWWRITKDKSGNIVDHEAITQNEALGVKTDGTRHPDPASGATSTPEVTPTPATETTTGTPSVTVPLPPPEGGFVDAPEEVTPTPATETTTGTPSVTVPLPPPEGGFVDAPEEMSFAEQMMEAFRTATTPDKGAKSVSIELTLPPAEQAIDIVTGGLVANEGTGDTLTGIATGEGGITDVRRAEIEGRKGRPLTDAQARNEAVREDSAALHDRMPGFGKLDGKVQAALIDLSYNIGVNKVLDPTKFPKLQEAVAQGNVEAILMNTLNTAMVDKKSVKGLALRRARMFNQANTNPELNITDVEQLGDGTINYLSGNRVIYTFKRPRHQDSSIGTVSVAEARNG